MVCFVIGYSSFIEISLQGTCC